MEANQVRQDKNGTLLTAVPLPLGVVIYILLDFILRFMLPMIKCLSCAKKIVTAFVYYRVLFPFILMKWKEKSRTNYSPLETIDVRGCIFDFLICSSRHLYCYILSSFLWWCAGCTPLHWAAIRGNLEVCTLLVHAGTKEELSLKDSGGFTPVQLAADKGHLHLSYILVRYPLGIVVHILRASLFFSTEML